MKKLMIVISLLMTSLSAVAHLDGPGVSNAKALELAAHRVERLAILGKIDASFLKKLDKMEVAVVPNQAPVYYKVRISQTQPTQGAALQLDLTFNEDGKALEYQVLPGGSAGPDLGWSDMDAASLLEGTLHYILDNKTDAKISSFDKGIASIVLSKETLNGESVARAQASSILTSEKLNIYLKLNGAFISAEIVP
ncbi:MAG: DUF6488 family protein [Pseudobdellovibrionaceae bacterium]